ncbi:DinB family protein [Brevibacillus migulae]|uniref:DinB family protein n=1 Tax=Brevibacillus migulae TaxID=1644114 RepID=UPI00106F09B1|nr:DinB family protein [Brevibacillus migulae]
MNQIMKKQFELTRSYFIKRAEESIAIAHIQPDGFNNTIHWHIGHVLTLSEQLLFGFPQKSAHLPADYIQYFASGTKPADWNDDVPSVETLIQQLKDQLPRILEIHADHLQQSLSKPILDLSTYEELACLALLDEANHLGQIQAMKRVIENAERNRQSV